MKRYTFHIDEEQLKRLEKLPGNVSEHLRGAINDYLEKLEPKPVISPSTIKVTICSSCGKRKDIEDYVCSGCGGKKFEQKMLSGGQLV